MRTTKTKINNLIILKSKNYEINVLRELVVKLKDKKA